MCAVCVLMCCVFMWANGAVRRTQHAHPQQASRGGKSSWREAEGTARLAKLTSLVLVYKFTSLQV